MRIVFRALVLMVLAGCLITSSPARACPACKDTVANSDASATAGGSDDSGNDANGSVAGGFNTSIYFMLGGLVLVGGFVVRMIVKETRA